MSLPEPPQAAHRSPRLDLAARATLFCLALLALMGSLIVLFMANVQRTQLENAARDAAERMALLAGREAGAALTAGSAAPFAEILDRVSRLEHVRRAALMGADGRVLAAQGQGPSPNESAAARMALASSSIVYAASRDRLIIAAPQRSRGAVAGVMIVELSRASLFSAVDRAGLVAIAALGLVLLLAAPITYLAARRITSPLRALTDFVRAQHSSPNRQRLLIDAKDEFGVLADAFNALLNRLDDRMRDIERLTYIDQVTGLPNQARFEQEVTNAIAQADKGAGQSAVAIFDFPGARTISESLDRDAAHQLTRLIAQRLQASVSRLQARDRTLIACLRNDEFAILSRGFASSQETAQLIHAISAAMMKPLPWRGDKIHLTPVCGLAHALKDGENAETLLRHAAMALRAGRRERTPVRAYSPDLAREAMHRLRLARTMRSALAKNEFRAFFQPKVNLLTGRIESAEALARWVREDRTIIGPAKFIPVAEECGLIGDVSEAVLREACWKAAAWAREGAPIVAAVNISALQFHDDRFVDRVLKTIEHADLPPSLLELEITESVAMADPERAISMIEPLRERGVRFAIDDFGCGHSSLSALTRLPFDVLKIDRQFVSGVAAGDRNAAAIVDTILAMARALGLHVVGEGVERPEEAQFLIERGCRLGQGFLYSPAVPAGEFQALLRKERAGLLLGARAIAAA